MIYPEHNMTEHEISPLNFGFNMFQPSLRMGVEGRGVA